MSRKPTAIRLSNDDNQNPSETEQKTKPKPKPQAKRKATASKPKTHRAPVAMIAPKQEEHEDVFDQTPFQETEITKQQSSYLPDIGKGIRWFGIFISAILTLISILVVTKIQAAINDFFLIHPAFGWTILGITAIAALALTALCLREFISLMHLKKLGNIRHDAEQVLFGMGNSAKTIKSIKKLYSSRPDMQWHIDELNSYNDQIIDGADHIKLTEKTLMAPLDNEAKQVIASSAKRISVVTALNPSPVLDILFVGFQILQMLRKVMAIYGGKPAFFGAMKLVRMVASHLAITGGLAVSDTLLQQFLGKGLAGRLSTKLGEGTVNGIMATRIGLAAIDLCRPMPFTSLEKPGLKSFLSELFSSKSQ